MSVNVTKNIALELTVTIDAAPVTFECQALDCSLSLPGSQPGESVETACPDGIVSEPGTTTNGALTGTVFTDTTATGISWALMNAYMAGDEFTYSFTWFSDQPNTTAVLFTGTGKVNSFQLDWTKPGNAKHPLDLALISATIGRPTVLAAV